MCSSLFFLCRWRLSIQLSLLYRFFFEPIFIILRRYHLNSLTYERSTRWLRLLLSYVAVLLYLLSRSLLLVVFAWFFFDCLTNGFTCESIVVYFPNILCCFIYSFPHHYKPYTQSLDRPTNKRLWTRPIQTLKLVFFVRTLLLNSYILEVSKAITMLLKQRNKVKSKLDRIALAELYGVLVSA